MTNTFRSTLVYVLDEMADALKDAAPGYHFGFMEQELEKLRRMQWGAEICSTCSTAGFDRDTGHPCKDCKGEGYIEP